MEMEKVPAAGYPIKGLPVAGFDRKNLLRNFAVVLKLRKSVAVARRIVRDFRPDIAIGVGGYASGPTLKAAGRPEYPLSCRNRTPTPGSPTNCWQRRPDAYAWPTEEWNASSRPTA